VNDEQKAPRIMSQGMAEDDLPLENYDSMSTDEIVEKLAELSPEDVEKLCRYELANENRKTLRRYFKDRIGAAAGTSGDGRESPPPGEERPEKRRAATAMRTSTREDPPPGEERPERRVT
jgi:hypothetical protein